MASNVVVLKYKGDYRVCPISEGYIVSPEGDILSRVKKPSPKRVLINGIEHVSLNGRKYRIEDVVYTTFVGPIPRNMVAVRIHRHEPISPNNLVLDQYNNHYVSKLKWSSNLVNLRKAEYIDGEWLLSRNKSRPVTLTVLGRRLHRTYQSVHTALKKAQKDGHDVAIIVDRYNPFVGYAVSYVTEIAE